jgi:hypothetical protein
MDVSIRQSWQDGPSVHILASILPKPFDQFFASNSDNMPPVDNQGRSGRLDLIQSMNAGVMEESHGYLANII